MQGVSSFLGLKRIKKNKRGAIYGFSVKYEDKYALDILEKGLSLIIIRETGRYIGKVKERWPVIKMIKREV